MRKILTLAILACVGCTVSRTVHRKDGSTTTTTVSVPVEYQVGTVWHCEPTVYYYQPASVDYAATYCGWSRSRVEYYFSIGWTCDDLIIGFEVSRRTRKPWRDVCYSYETSRRRHRAGHLVSGSSGCEVWRDVAQQCGDTYLVQNTDSHDTYNTYVDQSQHTAITQVYNIDQSTHITNIVQDNSVDIGTIVNAIEVADGKDPHAFAEAVKVEDAKLDALEDKIEAGDTAGLEEAVPDSKESDWTPSQEDKVDDAPAGEKVEEPKEEDPPKMDEPKDEPKGQDEENPFRR